MDTYKLEQLAHARVAKEHFKAQMDQAIADLKATKPYQEYEYFYLMSKAQEESLTAEIKAGMIEDYKANPVKKLEYGEIKTFTEAKINDPEKAREWCLTNFRPAIVLDEKTFIDTVKADLKGKRTTIPAELYTVTVEDRAQIKADLSAYLIPAITGEERA